MMAHRVRRLVAAVLFAALPVPALAQGAEIAFGARDHDASLPVEITADRLQIGQADGTAVFSGNVLIAQGEMRLSAENVLVSYAEGTEQARGRVERLEASGGVTLISGAEAAESREAVYTVGSGQIVMSGDVLLTQGRNALSGERLIVDLNTGSGVMEGRVRTILQTGGSP